jgi:hypothetical protein
MSVPPRTERDQSGWEVAGDQPVKGRRHERPDRLGLAMVAIVLIAVVVAVGFLVL